MGLEQPNLGAENLLSFATPIPLSQECLGAAKSSLVPQTVVKLQFTSNGFVRATPAFGSVTCSVFAVASTRGEGIQST